MRITLQLLLALLLGTQALAVQTAPKRQKPRAPRAAAQPQAAAEKPADGEDEAADYRFGEFTVPIDVSKLRATINIGMAPHMVTVVEFPGNDPVYSKHPGDENFVTIDDKESKADDMLVLRPGDGFAVPNLVAVQKGKRTVYVPARPKPATNITVQMTSGLPITLVIYPVRSAARNANRVVVTYDREKVIEARRQAGLRADLVPPAKMVEQLGYDPTGRAQSSNDVAQLVQTAPPAAPTQTPQPTPAPRAAQSSPLPQVARTFVPVSSTGEVPQPRTITAAEVRTPAPAPSVPSASSAPPPSSTTAEAPADLEQLAREEMARVMKAGTQLKFGKPTHGLSLAVSRSRFVIAGYRIEVVAVRNALSEPIRLVPGQPEIYVERANQGPIDSDRLVMKSAVSTLPDNAVLSPGGTYFFAFAFEEPILSASEELRVAVAQTNAADVPVSASLITAAR